METAPSTYVMADDNTFINTKKIYWVKTYKECLIVCAEPSGCTSYKGTKVICKQNNLDNFLKLQKQLK